MATVYVVEVSDTRVLVFASFEGDGGVHGDIRKSLGPGDEFAGLTFEELKEAGVGPIETPPEED